MTGNAFLKRLLFQLDFLSEKDQEAVFDFYKIKLAEANTLLEEEELIRRFGSPEQIAQKLKEAFEKKENTEDFVPSGDGSDSAEDCSPDNTNNIADTSASDTIKDFLEMTTDVIFSKPLTVENNSESVYALENDEIPSLYGEKVTTRDRVDPIEELVLEPLDVENGLTVEEIKMAKESTLQKADSFDKKVAEKIPTAIENQAEKTITHIDSEKVESVAEQTRVHIETEPEEEPKKAYNGLFKKLFSFAESKSTFLLLTVLASVLISPLLFLAFGFGLLTYAVILCLAGALCVIAGGIVVLLVLGGVVELIHGLALLFEVISVALIEIGLGTVIFSFVTAVSALIYEFLFGIIPKVVKWITKRFIHYIRHLFCFLYGGEA